VAVKVLPGRLVEDTDALARFEREARAVAALSHPNILAIHDFGRDGGIAYAVTELLEGDTLRTRLQASALPLRKVAEYGVQIARGLAAAHDRDIVHRDLKPDNVFVTRDGQVKIFDFGLAKAQSVQRSGSETDSPTLFAGTNPGMVMGTAAYMSPEQVRGHEVDHRSDIFSFGSVLYEMVTGQRAFHGESVADTMSAILHSEPPVLSTHTPFLPPALARIVRRCLEKDREARFQSARDLAFDLEDLTTSGSGASSPAASSTSGRIRWWAALAGIALVAVGLAVGFAAARYTITPTAVPRLTPRFQQLTDVPRAETSPRLSFDGRTLLFVRRATGNADIYLQRVGGHNPIDITRDCAQADTAPAFSPDGDRVPFRSECEGGGIFVMGATGESRNRVTDFGYDPSWSPDGRRLVVATEGVADPLNRFIDSELWIVDISTGERRKLARAMPCSLRGHLMGGASRTGDFAGQAVNATSGPLQRRQAQHRSRS